nr:ribonuclease H-like domain-containing protein [Tanacetum cinerariifolium]
NALVSQCDGVGSYDWSYQVKEEPANYALMAFSSSSTSSDNEVPSCSKACSKAFAQFHSQYDKLTANFRKSQFDVISYQTGTFMPSKLDLVFNTAPTTVETDHPAFNVQLSPTKPEQDLSHTTRPTAPIIKDWVSDSEDESETKAPQIVPSFVQSTEQVKSPRHSVQHVDVSIPSATLKPASPKPTSSGKRRNKKACFVCKIMDHLIKDCDYHAKKMAQPTPRNHAHRGNHKQYAPLTHTNPQKHMVPTVVLTQSKPDSITAVRPVSGVVPKIKVTRPRLANPIVTKSKSPIKRHITCSPSLKISNSPPKVTAVKASVGNPQHALKDKGVIDSGCSRYMTGNMSYLSDFEELNGGYVAFGGNPKGGKISGKGKIRTCTLDFDDVFFVKELKFNLFSVSQMCDKKNSVLFTNTECLVLSPDFKLPNESQVLLRVPRENNMYNVNLKNIVPSGDLTCLFAKATLDESNLWHRRLGHINFKTINKLNNDGDATFDRKEPDIDAKKPESEVNVSPSSSAQSRKQDDKTKKEAKGKIPTIGQNSPNNTKTFSAAGPSNAAASPTYRKSSFIDASQLPDDLDMPELEDITYSDDEDDVGAEADFNNLETSITFSPIPTTRVHKDHHISQIIGDLSLTTQTRSMTSVVKDQGGLSQIFNDDFHTCMFACFLSHKEPKRIYVDDIIFGATNKDLCKSFKKLMKDKFQMSSMGELTFFLGLQVKQKKDEIFISQDKYVAKILRKFRLTKGKSASTPIDTEKPLLKDFDGEDVDVHTYRLMIGSLMYLTLLRPDIMFASWLVQKQTALGKDRSNSLIADSLLKTIWSSIHHLLINEVLTILGQTATGVNTPRCDEDRLELIELTVFVLPKVEKVRIGVNVVDLQVSAVRHMLRLLVHKLLLFSLTNRCCSLSAVRSSS